MLTFIFTFLEDLKESRMMVIKLDLWPKIEGGKAIKCRECFKWPYLLI